MIKLDIKEIKGNKYLYLRENLKVNSKSLVVALYCGRLDKITRSGFAGKLGEFAKLRITKYLEYRTCQYVSSFFDPAEIAALERMRFYYAEFAELYTDESTRYAESVFVRYVQGTTAIEGNTISPQEAGELLEHNISPAGKNVSEVYEILNFVKLRDYLTEYKGDVSEKLVKAIHRILMADLMRSPGEYRRVQVGIEKVDYAPPPAILIPEMMKDLAAWYRKNSRKIHPFELAVLLHAKFELIHPFPDGNGRVGRALMNFVLERAGYPALYLGLSHRTAYLDAFTAADDEDFVPMMKALHRIYLDQHAPVMDQVRNTLETESEKTPAFRSVMKEFSRLKR